GEELLRVRQDGKEIPLYRYIADKLAERLEIPADALPVEASLNAVVCHYLQSGGVPEEVYPKIRPILNQARFAPPEPLLQLARIDRFRLFVVLTFDSLLAAAIDQVRFGGDNRTLELAYSPRNVQDLPGPIEELRQPIVYHLLGKLSAPPDYVITDEGFAFAQGCPGTWTRRSSADPTMTSWATVRSSADFGGDAAKRVRAAQLFLADAIQLTRRLKTRTCRRPDLFRPKRAERRLRAHVQHLR
ncbi:MAG TPA: hypothetical protein VF969_06550, partial [Burkholderiales bacterium]